MAKLRHEAIGNYAWMRIIERADLPSQVKLTGFILAINANADGSRARVSEKYLGDATIYEERYASDALDVLELLGLIEVTKHGRRAGDANTYQLTTPGGHLPAIEMRLDERYKPINADGSRRTGKRDKPLATRPMLMALKGRPLPDRPMPDIDRTGNPVPLRLVDNSVSADEYRQPGAATEPDPAERYRQPVADVPATRCGRTGNPLPPTNLYQLLPTNSPQVTQSPTADDQACGKSEAEVDPEYETARAALAAMRRPVADAWRHAARAEFETAGEPLSRRAVEIRAADLAAGPTTGAATA